MKLLPVLPHPILGKSASGLAVRVSRPLPPEMAHRPLKASPFGLWLPLSCVIVSGGCVIAVADGLRRKYRLTPAVSLRD